MGLNKVDLCGMNTSHLPLLSNEEKDQLFEQIEQGDRTARERLIEGNLRLVLSVIQRFSSNAEQADDLFQIGCIGLMKAIDNFDRSLNVRFSTYAVPMIIGEIRRYLRDNSSYRIPRSLRDIAYKAMQIKEKIMAESDHEPSVEEVAKKLDIKKETLVIALESVVEPVSLYEPVFSDGNDTIYVMDQIGNKNEDINWLDEIVLKESISKLNEREKKILTLRFLVGKTQMEVASEVGISQAQVSRLEKYAMDKIKGHV